MTLGPDQSIDIRILSTPGHLPVVRAAMEKVCEMAGLDSDAAGHVVLSVDEALANIIRHAYDNAADQPIEVSIQVTGRPPERTLRIRLRDYGRVVDPAEIRSRDLADIRPGGLGVHIIKECMDGMEYRPAEGGGTLLTLTKALAGCDDGAET